jgi:hypothetical protein
VILDRKEKQPIEIKDYPISYAEWLAEAGDVLTDVQASIVCLTDPDDTALVVHNLTLASTVASVWLSGGTDGQRYKVIVTVTTQGGRRDQSEFIMKIKDY